LAAGALATIAMLLEEAAPAFLRAQGVAALLVDAQGQVLRLAPEPDLPLQG
jgi:thiamine biosynthesis lipoprotein ApbE